MRKTKNNYCRRRGDCSWMMLVGQLWRSITSRVVSRGCFQRYSDILELYFCLFCRIFLRVHFLGHSLSVLSAAFFPGQAQHKGMKPISKSHFAGCSPFCQMPLARNSFINLASTITCYWYRGCSRKSVASTCWACTKLLYTKTSPIYRIRLAVSNGTAYSSLTVIRGERPR